MLLTVGGSESSRNAIVEVRTTTSPGVEQNFTAVGTNLISDVDSSSVTVSGGRLLAAVTLGGQERSTEIDLGKLQIRVPPGLHIVVQAILTGGSSTDLTATLTWYEDL